MTVQTSARSPRRAAAPRPAAPRGCRAGADLDEAARRAPLLMHDALVQIIAEDREGGYFDQPPYHPKAGCACGGCRALRALAAAERGGRCILCGCTQTDACDPPCAWADAEQLVCDAHPPKMIVAALRHLRREVRRA